MDHSTTYFLPNEFQPSKRDVICGRGKKCYGHVGNQRFREMVLAKLDDYSQAKSKLAKSGILWNVVANQVRRKGGYFVKQDKFGRWYDVGDFHAREKASQMFRDALHDQYKSSKAAKKRMMKERRQREKEQESSGKTKHSAEISPLTEKKQINLSLSFSSPDSVFMGNSIRAPSSHHSVPYKNQRQRHFDHQNQNIIRSVSYPPGFPSREDNTFDDPVTSRSHDEYDDEFVVGQRKSIFLPKFHDQHNHHSMLPNDTLSSTPLPQSQQRLDEEELYHYSTPATGRQVSSSFDNQENRVVTEEKRTGEEEVYYCPTPATGRRVSSCSFDNQENRNVTEEKRAEEVCYFSTPATRRQVSSSSNDQEDRIFTEEKLFHKRSSSSIAVAAILSETEMDFVPEHHDTPPFLPEMDFVLEPGIDDVDLLNEAVEPLPLIDTRHQQEQQNCSMGNDGEVLVLGDPMQHENSNESSDDDHMFDPIPYSPIKGAITSNLP